jgi:hypothetical protein
MSTVPVQVVDLNFETVRYVACGRKHTLAMINTGQLYVCGLNGLGQLGLGDTVTRRSFTLASDVIKLQGGQDCLWKISSGMGDYTVMWAANSKSLTDIRGIDRISLQEIEDLVAIIDNYSLPESDISAAGTVLTQKVSSVFSYLACLNASFLPVENSSFESTIKTLLAPSVAAAKKGFGLLVGIKNVSWRNQILVGMENPRIVLSMTCDDSKATHSYQEALRGLLLLTLNPLLADCKKHSALIAQYLTAFERLSKYQWDVLTKWWREIPDLVETFESFTQVVNAALTHWVNIRYNMQPIASAAYVLRRLWDANNLPCLDDDKLSLDLKSSSKVGDNKPATATIPLHISSNATANSNSSLPHSSNPVQITMASIGFSSPEFKLSSPPSPKTLLPHSIFQNITISRSVNMMTEFLAFYGQLNTQQQAFSFCRYPFLFDLAAKVELLQLDARRQMIEYQSVALARHMLMGGGENTGQRPYVTLKVHRNELFMDAMVQISTLDISELRKPLKVQFIDEIGVDDGGIAREFMSLFFNHLLTKTDMFVENFESSHINGGGRPVGLQMGYIWFNPTTKATTKAFRAVGRALGLSLFNSCLCSLSFPLVLFHRLLGWPVSLDDLGQLRPHLVRGLRELLVFEPASDVESTFGLEFSVVKPTIEVLGTLPEERTEVKGFKVVPLEPYANQPVTGDNRNEYVDALVR